MNLRNPLILALDVDTDHEAMGVLERVGHLIGAVKVGPRLNLRFGSRFIQELGQIAPVFVDNKYFDIESTVVAAVRASFEAGATLVTVHALNGTQTLAKLQKIETEFNAIRPFKILAVTVLTSWGQKNLPENFKSLSVNEHVHILANIVRESGLNGIVCSGHELATLSSFNLFKVTPGIRLADEFGSGQQDQQRVMTPAAAMRAGASALVIGRSILNAPDPVVQVQAILESLKL